ncbi:uncharacterized protein LAESUDRAFT_137380 [Laetiporus sulphureus 93-53]|uniref:Uncharacterized protein n=1 Tax=Laetiporus sulphureus 93-53 TaxID=1314785 RepID=A0A165EDE7_9APHY|nr:uncharacterized protein LAESUDRAFT_137380 [Laetiporus sulphureus 93-53]KZT06795.1 hypothetical protein LAESUDRAFT_137380 [Laetiporus sulphureus 93-53]
MRVPVLACAVFAAALSSPLVAALPPTILRQVFSSGSSNANIEHRALGEAFDSSSLKVVPLVEKVTGDQTDGSPVSDFAQSDSIIPGAMKARSTFDRLMNAIASPNQHHARDTADGSTVPASHDPLQSRDEPRRLIIGTAMSKPANIGPRQPSEKRALDKDTAGGNAYSGSTGDASGGSVESSLHDMASNFRSAYPKRTDDADTMGGNGYTGSTGDVSGGSISNIANNDGMPTLMNINSNNAGAGGTSASGCASGGHTNTTGAGGNAYSGSTGKAEGGSVSNVGGMINMNSNNGGAAGTSQSGCATGGNVGDDKGTTTTNDDTDEDWMW